MARHRLFASAGLFIAACFAPVTQAAIKAAAEATPIQSVVNVLQTLDADLEAEGKGEAAEYDKYACWAKDSATGKQLDIEKATKTMEQLQADIKDLEGKITHHNAAVSEVNLKLSHWTGLKRDATAKRDDERLTANRGAAALAASINTIKSATATLQATKDEMASRLGSEDIKLDLAQFKGLDEVIKKSRSPNATAFLQAPVPVGEPVVRYEYHSNAFLDFLTDLKLDLVKQLDENRKTEDTAQHNYEMQDGEWEDMINAWNKEKSVNQELADKLNEDKEEKQSEWDQLYNDRAEDKRYLKELTADSEQKAATWDQRSMTRSAERATIAKCIEELRKSVVPNDKALKDVYLVQKSAKVSLQRVDGKHEDGSVTPKRATTFLQVVRLHGKNADEQKQKSTMQLVESFLMKTAKSLQSSTLVAAAAHVLGAPSFDAVTQLIQQLIVQLESESTEESGRKAHCDELHKITDDTIPEVERLKGEESRLNNEVLVLQEEIADLRLRISQSAKRKLELNELSTEASKKNAKNIAMCKEGEQGVYRALQILDEFYAFIQTDSKTSKKQPGGTLAADPFAGAGNYGGKQAQGAEIIHQLQDIQSDFDRQIKETELQEQQNIDETKSLIVALDQESTNAHRIIGGKADAITRKKAELSDIAAQLMNQHELHKAYLKEVANLKAACVSENEVAGQYERRKAARAKELEALKKANTTLVFWDKPYLNPLLHTSHGTGYDVVGDPR